MRVDRSKLYIILLTIFIDLVGFGIVIPVLPLYAKHFGASEAVNGWLVGIYSGVQFLAAPILGRLSDRVGRRPVLILSLLGTAFGFFLMGWATTLTLLFAARIIDGISGGNISTANAYLADITAPEERSKAMGMVGAAFGLGFIIGPAIGGVLGYLSLSAPYYFAGALAFLNAILVYLRLPESLPLERRIKAHERPGLAEVVRHSTHLPVLLGAYFLVIVGFSIMTTNFSLFTHERFGLDEMHNAYLFAFIGLVGAVIQGGLLRKALRRWSERGLAVAGGVILMAGLALLPLSAGIATLLMFSAVVAVGNSFIMPTLNGMASRHADQSWQGRVMGMMQSAGSLARLVGPVLGGWLLAKDPAGSTTYGRSPFWAAAVVLILAVFFTVRIPVIAQRE